MAVSGCGLEVSGRSGDGAAAGCALASPVASLGPGGGFAPPSVPGATTVTETVSRFDAVPANAAFAAKTAIEMPAKAYTSLLIPNPRASLSPIAPARRRKMGQSPFFAPT